MILTMLEPGMSCRILAVRGNDTVKKHLGGLGFVAGSEITVVAESGGSLIVNIKGARLALGRQLACKILLDGTPYPGTSPSEATVRADEAPAPLLA